MIKSPYELAVQACEESGNSSNSVKINLFGLVILKTEKTEASVSYNAGTYSLFIYMNDEEYKFFFTDWYGLYEELIRYFNGFYDELQL